MNGNVSASCIKFTHPFDAPPHRLQIRSSCLSVKNDPTKKAAQYPGKSRVIEQLLQGKNCNRLVWMWGTACN
jgi:hypothetical protein